MCERKEVNSIFTRRGKKNRKEKRRERKDNNFNFHTWMKMVGEEDIIRKMEREERRQFQFLHMDENGGRGRKQLEKWRERKDDNFNFHT